MDKLTWFKSVFRARPTSGVLRADMAAGSWADVPQGDVTVRSWPPPPPAEADEDWDAMIARAKAQASPIAPIPRPFPQARPIAAPAPRSSLARQAQAVRRGAPQAPTPPSPVPPRDEWLDTPDTPPPSPVRQVPTPLRAKVKAPRTRAPEKTQATLDALVWGRSRKPAPRPVFAARRPAPEDIPTPLPLVEVRRVRAPFPRPAK
jgi:hypothetical protein